MFRQTMPIGFLKLGHSIVVKFWLAETIIVVSVFIPTITSPAGDEWL